MRRVILPLAFAIFVVLSTVKIAAAGGWAVVTLDHLPSELIVNQPVTIGFNVRQHGQTLLAGLQPTIAATRVGSNETVTAIAHDEGSTGHYVATLTFASVGEWEWYIDAFGSRQPMPSLAVAASQPISSGAYGDSHTPGVPVPSSQEISLGGVFVILIGTIVLLIAWQRRQFRWWIVPLTIGMVLGAASIALADRLPQPVMSATSDNRNSVDLVQEGRDLFLAKGCIVCHQNDHVQFHQEDFVQVKIGPDLTNRKLTSEFLHIWLKDPSKVKPGTLMPTLGLSDHEIDALAAFLTEHGESR
jgi:mono/diheme cytochrome c family protein